MAAQRAAARRAADSRTSRLASRRSRTLATISGRARSGRPQSNGGAGAYSMPSCTAWAKSAPAISPTTLSARSIPAVTPPPVIRLPSGIRHGSEDRQQVSPSPVTRGALAAQQTGSTQQQRTAADGGDVPRLTCEPAYSGEILRILHGLDRAESAGHTQKIAATNRGKPYHRAEGHAPLRLDALTPARCQDGACPRQARKHFVRPGEVELGDLGIEGEDEGLRAAPL